MQSRMHALIVRVHDREELFREACRIAVEAGAFTMAWIGLQDTDSSQVQVVASYGERVKEYLKDIEAEVPLSAGPAGTAITENRPVWIQNSAHQQPTRHAVAPAQEGFWMEFAGNVAAASGGRADWRAGAVCGRDWCVR